MDPLFRETEKTPFQKEKRAKSCPQLYNVILLLFQKITRGRVKKIQAVELTELAHAALIHKTKTGPQGPVSLFAYFRVSHFVSVRLLTPVSACNVSPYRWGKTTEEEHPSHSTWYRFRKASAPSFRPVCSRR